ncbi:hypothetical protein ACQ1Q1_04350 [Ornithobacterium rhinotracheale]|uniref:hypothetical protein n=1 Tax=Ornithobacterium rhinotracheale TaxID=28251 RepID=UPI000304921D|nr:hypothetical protein [Ornithobacterium rhinotracheale]KGB67359.1 hypothetical protein Q787_04345 [Ornithobacterium rhinotracheale H06-030791]MBN3662974.1 hypothetical protein [Ornithobacterium rhinotracheale]MCK0194501.1 hypothetical protein [Ornithobacterium rhinotracheale]MCK0202757.1 hypothetical protein [Ornithobacterium rhinotracheale]UOH64598.1 hypothetical protein MT993_05120 [Ornithobacterium rhinotracheale]
MFNVAPGLELGVVTGYQEYFGKNDEVQILDICGTKYETYKIKNDNIGMFPLAAQLKYSLLPDLFVSADLGAGLFIGSDSETVFYYQPKVGYQSGRSEVALAYRGMSVDGASGSAISLGYAYNF